MRGGKGGEGGDVGRCEGRGTKEGWERRKPLVASGPSITGMTKSIKMPWKGLGLGLGLGLGFVLLLALVLALVLALLLLPLFLLL